MTDSARTVEAYASFISQSSAIFGAPLEYERMLPRIARLALPLLGDLCAIDVQDEDGALRRVACAHVDTTKEGPAYEARARYGFNPAHCRRNPENCGQRRQATPRAPSRPRRAARTPRRAFRVVRWDGRAEPLPLS
jgi:hypothetical protein